MRPARLRPAVLRSRGAARVCRARAEEKERGALDCARRDSVRRRILLYRWGYVVLERSAFPLEFRHGFC